MEKILEWVAISFCRGSSQPRDQSQVSSAAGGFFTSRATGEAHIPRGGLWEMNWKFFTEHKNSGTVIICRGMKNARTAEWRRLWVEWPNVSALSGHPKVFILAASYRAYHAPGCRWIHPSSPHSSVQFSHSVLSDSLRPHGLQHPRLRCPSPTPRIYSNSCPLSRWCHPTISSSVVPFFSCLQSFPVSESFQMS